MKPCCSQTRERWGALRHLAAERVGVLLRNALLAACLVLHPAWFSPALAQSTPFVPASRTFLQAFPKDDIYRVTVFGDTWAQGLVESVRASLSDEQRTRVSPSVRQFLSLTSSGWSQNLERVTAARRSDGTDIAIVMTGAYDRSGLRGENTARALLGTSEWRSGYEERLAALLKAFADAEIAVYWIGQPVTMSANRTQHAQLINEITRDLAFRGRIRFLDIYDIFLGPDGGYTDYAPDVEGKQRRMRWRDGLHFSRAGYDRIADFVRQAIREDVVAAFADRDVTLLGDETQQSAVRALDQVEASARTGGGIVSSILGPLGFDGQGPSATAAPRFGPATIVGLEGETATVQVPVSDGEGRNRKLKISIERPAVAPSIVQLVSERGRQKKLTTLGDTITLVGPDDMPLAATVIPSSETAFEILRRTASPTQTPMFRVWARGERLAPVEGRGDDVSWEPPQQVRIAAQPAALIEEPPLDPDIVFKAEAAVMFEGPPLPTRNPQR